jgi:hypothetical protein
MATSTHLAELVQLHRKLNDELAEALQHPSVDDSTLADLKRRKLQLKDEMARLTQMERDGVLGHSQERANDGFTTQLPAPGSLPGIPDS